MTSEGTVYSRRDRHVHARSNKTRTPAQTINDRQQCCSIPWLYGPHDFDLGRHSQECFKRQRMAGIDAVQHDRVQV